MRYPIPFWLWFIPPLWPLLAIVTVVWILCSWTGWWVAHLLVTLGTTSWLFTQASGGSSTAGVWLTVLWSTLVVHSFFYLRYQPRLAQRRAEEAARRQYEYDVAQAQYWAQVHRDAVQRGH